MSEATQWYEYVSLLGRAVVYLHCKFGSRSSVCSYECNLEGDKVSRILYSI